MSTGFPLYRYVWAVALLLALGLLIGRPARSAQAGSILCAPTVTVTTTADSGNGSLRQAIIDLCDGGTIDFDATLDGQTIALTSGELWVLKTATISSDIVLAISAGGLSRVLHVDSIGDLTLSGVTLRDGLTTQSGGGVRVAGRLILSDATVTASQTTGSQTRGGGIFVAPNGVLELRRVTISNNDAPTYGSGGGLYNERGTVLIENSTVSGNMAGELRFGGGVGNEGTTQFTINMTIINSTITNNCASDSGGLYSSQLHTVRVTNTVLAGNTVCRAQNPADNGTPSDMQQPFVSGGHNLVGAATDIQTSAAGDQYGTLATPLAAQLGALANNGGPTLTHMPAVSSPLIDAGDNSAAPGNSDQRGHTRIWDSGTRALTVDIGAVEFAAPLAVELLTFEAAPRANGSVRVTWETASEIDSAGFNVWRSAAAADGSGADGSNRIMVNGALIAATGSNGLGDSYAFTEWGVPQGVWHYWLEEIDTRGISTLHGPAIAEVTAPTAVALNALGVPAVSTALALLALALVAISLSVAVVRRRRS